MSLFFQFILTILLGFLAHWLLPWWWVLAPAAFAVALFFPQRNSALVFFSAFLGGALLWWGVAFYQSWLNHHILAERMGLLFGGLHPTAMELLTGILGGLLAGLGALSANLGRKMFIKKEALATKNAS
ncbi:MAG: hypothetical protein WA004_07155 [Saprospiraceae bacterium]